MNGTTEEKQVFSRALYDQQSDMIEGGLGKRLTRASRQRLPVLGNNENSNIMGSESINGKV
jgi:hypothetical protein